MHALVTCRSRAGHVPVMCRSRAGQSQLRQLARHLGLREPGCWACITLRGTRGGRQHHVSMPAARDSQHGWQPGLISRWVSAVGEPGLVFRGGRWRPLRAQLTLLKAGRLLPLGARARCIGGRRFANVPPGALGGGLDAWVRADSARPRRQRNAGLIRDLWRCCCGGCSITWCSIAMRSKSTLAAAGQ